MDLGVVIKPVFVVLIGCLFLRLIGNRSVAQMKGFDLLIVAMLSIILAAPIASQRIVPTVIGVMVLFAMYYVMNGLNLIHPFHKAMSGEPKVLVRHGNIDEINLKKAKMTIPELLAALRVKGYTEISDVEFAILESSGDLSVIPRAEKRNVTLQDLNIVPGYDGLPVPLIVDGRFQDDNLARIGMTRQQLLDRLVMQGVPRDGVQAVSLALLNAQGQIALDWNDDLSQGNLPPGQQNLFSQVKQSFQVPKKKPEEKDLGIVDDYIKP